MAAGLAKTANPFRVHPNTGGTYAGQFLPGPVSIADADAWVHVPGGSGPGRRGRTQAATRGKPAGAGRARNR